MVLESGSVLSGVKKALEEYEYYYQKGLKREANKRMDELAEQLHEVVPLELREQILYELCEEICDKQDPQKLKKRGNGRLPFALDRILWEYLQEQCRKGKMPQLRWTYELYQYNPFQKDFDPSEILLQAFEHKECDKRTEELYFNTFLSDLAWGAHHFPEGCLLSRDQYEKIIEESHGVILKRDISNQQIEELDYYERLYRCWYKYVDSGRKSDFDELCSQAGIAFEPFKFGFI